MNYDKILVTGGAGFIGSNLINQLKQQGKEVIVFDNGFRVGFNNIEDDFQIITGDITKFSDWEKIPKDIDFVFHLGAINGTKYFYEIPEKVLETNVVGTFNMLKWIKNSSVKNFFFASSSEVYGFPKIFPTKETESLSIPDPTNPRFSYSSSKMIGEVSCINFAKKYGINYIIGRFHNVYGPKMGFEHVIPEFIRKIVKKEEFVVNGDGTESRCFCYIDDAINALILLLNSEKAKNDIFNIGIQDETTILELIKKLELISGETVNPKFTKFANAGTKRRVPDIEKIKELGYDPQISLEKGLKLSFDWYKKWWMNQ